MKTFPAVRVRARRPHLSFFVPLLASPFFASSLSCQPRRRRHGMHFIVRDAHGSVDVRNNPKLCGALPNIRVRPPLFLLHSVRRPSQEDDQTPLLYTVRGDFIRCCLAQLLLHLSDRRQRLSAPSAACMGPEDSLCCLPLLPAAIDTYACCPSRGDILDDDHRHHHFHASLCRSFPGGFGLSGVAAREGAGGLDLFLPESGQGGEHSLRCGRRGVARPGGAGLSLLLLRRQIPARTVFLLSVFERDHLLHFLLSLALDSPPHNLLLRPPSSWSAAPCICLLRVQQIVATTSDRVLFFFLWNCLDTDTRCFCNRWHECRQSVSSYRRWPQSRGVNNHVSHSR